MRWQYRSNKNMEQVMEKYGYKFEKVFDNTYRIMDNSCCSNYLVVGSRRAVLIDTGCGTGNLRKLADELAGTDYDVINTHGHTDHVAANYQFREIYIGREDEAMMRRLFESEEEKHIFYEEMRMYAADASHPGLEHFSAMEYRQAFETATVSFQIRYLEDGMTFDLGDTTLEAIHIPGHTPGGYVLLDTQKRRLFVGDAVLRHVSVLHEGGMKISDLISGMEKLQAMQDRFDWIIAAHGHRQPGFRPLEPEFISKLIECARSVDISQSSVRHEADGDGYEFYMDHKTHDDLDSVSIAYKLSSLQ